MANCPKCGIRILGDSTECPVCAKEGGSPVVSPSKRLGSESGKSRDGSARVCSKCGIRLLKNTTECPSCGDKKGLATPSSSSSGTGCGILVLLAIIVGLGFGLKSCVGMFSEEAQDQRKEDKYQRCIENTKKSLSSACDADACYTGCQMQFLDDAIKISNCITACEDKTWNERVEFCEDHMSTVEMRAILECPRK